MGTQGRLISPTSDPAWLIVEPGFVVAREHEVESIMAIANGYVGIRASLAEGALRSDPATYLANVYVDASTGPVLARTPQWLPLQAAVDGRRFSLEGVSRQGHRRVLDMREGLLWRDWTHVDEKGRQTRILGYRLASLANPHQIAQVVYLMPVNYGGEFKLDTGIGGASGYSTVFWHYDTKAASASTATADLGRGRQVSVAGIAKIVLPDGSRLAPEIEATPYAVHERWHLAVEPGKEYRLERSLFLYATADGGNPVLRAREAAAAWNPDAMHSEVGAHRSRWRRIWEHSDVTVKGDEGAQRALRFAAFHMSGCVSADAKAAAVGPRGLTGGGYSGHVFWDTEIFLFPFLVYTSPEKARAVLGYRYGTLPAAREEARKIGCVGANYAWESAESGREITPEWILTPDGQHARVYCGDEELHVTADIAYAIWQYWQATQDLHYLTEEGAEILIETARFWVSRAALEADGRYHLRKIMGPDEYHPTVDDNAYTNAMVRYNLQCAAEALEILARLAPEKRELLRQKLTLDEREPETWCEMAARMEKGRSNADGVIEQFAGYWELDPQPPRSKEAALLMQTEALRGTQVVKQADLVMLLALHPTWFSGAVQRANFRFYEPRTWHGSSLSPGIHALVAARLGEMGCAEKYFRQTAAIDLAMQGNAAVGVHLATLGSLWMAAVFGFGGVHFDGDHVRMRPHLPAGWQSLAFSLRYRGRTISFHCDGSSAAAEVVEGAPLDIVVTQPDGETRSPGRWKEAGTVSSQGGVR